MKTSIFIPLATEYDPDESTFKGTFGLSDAEIRDILVRTYQKHMESSDDHDLRAKSTDLFMEELQAQKISSAMILFFASYGFQKMFNDSSAGLSLFYFGDKEEREANGAS